MMHFKVKLQWRWYDLWIGVYIARFEQAIYICPLPTIVIKIEWFRNLYQKLLSERDPVTFEQKYYGNWVQGEGDEKRLEGK